MGETLSSRRPSPALALGLLAGALAAWRLWDAYRDVPSRLSLGWDAARRTILNLDAARALSRLDLGRLLWDLAGPETWPTLRMAVAAPLHALLGPAHAVESGLAVATAAALFPVLAAGTAPLGRAGGGAALLAVSALALLSNRALLAYAATPMLEVPGALLTLAATSAWLASREEGGSGRVWPTALLGNLLFHVKYQYGLLFAAGVLGVEWASLPREARRGGAAGLWNAAGEALRRRSSLAFLGGSAACLLAAAWVAGSGGLETRLLGVPIGLRSAHGPAFWAAFLAFAGSVHAAWASRETLRRAVPPRLRGLATWLLLPMCAWLLVPFTWRLRTLAVTAATYESGEAPGGLPGAALFYPRALWRSWPAPARVAVLIGLGLSTWSALRHPPTRRRLAAVGALAALELAALSLSRANFQARFALNLVPLLALAAALWAPALSRLPRAAAALALAALLAWPAAGLWRRGPLAETLAEGFAHPAIGPACAAAAGALPPEARSFVNLTPADYRQDCNLAVVLEARRRGGWAAERGPGDPGPGPLLLLAPDCRVPEGPLSRFSSAGPPVRAGEVCALGLLPPGARGGPDPAGPSR